MTQKIIHTAQIARELPKLLASIPHSSLFLAADPNTALHCLPLIQNALPEVPCHVLASGDENKNLAALALLWQFLSDKGANRDSLLINLGGGMLTDLAGFAAATFKRGIRFINIPTTLLGAVDAAVGGKTGINLGGLKNEIGAFAPAEAVLIDVNFFKTLPADQFLSGFAEMLKHALLDVPSTLNSLLSLNLKNIDYPQLKLLLRHSVQIKERIVRQDPTEQGLRKALNLGHTFGHAFESLSYELSTPLPHGYAVAFGLICELYLSSIKLNFDLRALGPLLYFVRRHYGKFAFDCNHYPRLLDLMRHDKKNNSPAIRFTLLRSIGKIEIDQTATQAEIEEVLDFYREN